MLSTCFNRCIRQFSYRNLTNRRQTKHGRHQGNPKTLISRFSSMAQRGTDYLVWVDLEMTGLNIDKDRIIEMAVIVTDKDLNLVAEVGLEKKPKL